MGTASLVIIFYVVFLALLISAELLKETHRTKEHFSKDFGPLHIHVDNSVLPPESHSVQWDDKYATLKATVFANYVKDLPELNPFKGERFGPYDVSMPDLHFNRGNLTFENVIVSGIKNIRFEEKVKMQLVPTRIDFSASIPNITVEADFNVDAVFDNHLPIRDSGHFKATLLEIVVTAAIGPNPMEFETSDAYQVESAAITIDLKDVQLHMDTKYAKEIQLILDEFFKHTENLIIDNYVPSIIIRAVNKELENIPAKKIVNYLLGPSEPNLSQFAPHSRKKIGRKHRKSN